MLCILMSEKQPTCHPLSFAAIDFSAILVMGAYGNITHCAVHMCVDFSAIVVEGVYGNVTHCAVHMRVNA